MWTDFRQGWTFLVNLQPDRFSSPIMYLARSGVRQGGFSAHGAQREQTVPINPIVQQKISSMQQVKEGDTIKVHYHGRLTSGETFDSSEGRQPLEFKVGAGMVIKGFDVGVMGMQVGDKKTINIPVDEAYGPVDPGMVIEFPKERFPQDLNPEVGMTLNMTNGSGQNFRVVVKEVMDQAVILDANHPLAGQDLVFDIEVVSIDGGSKIILEP